jgi:heat shock protein 5
LKEKTTWLEENPEAEAEDYEDQLSELQSTVGVSFSLSYTSIDTDE